MYQTNAFARPHGRRRTSLDGLSRVARALVVTAIFGLTTTAVTATDGASIDAENASVDLSASRLVVTPTADYDAARLVVAGPDGIVFRGAFDGRDLITYDLTASDRSALPDGTYNWELKLYVDATPRGDEDAHSVANVSRSAGTFEIRNGSAGAAQPIALPQPVLDDPAETIENHFVTDLGTSAEGCFGCSSNFEAGDSTFGGEGLTIIDLDPGINFLTSESTGDVADSGWEMGVAGDRFYISDLNDAGQNAVQPFAIEDNAPDKSIFVTTSGAIGVGTQVPDAQLHVAGTADVVLDGGLSEWSIRGGDDLVFHLEDDGSGVSHFDFLTLEDDFATTPTGVGLGIWRVDPKATFHVGSPNDGSAQVLVEENSPTIARRQLFRLENNGPPEFALVNTELDLTWKFGTRGNGFEINRGASGQTELFLRGNGDLEIVGTLSQGSSRSLKENFQAIDSDEILDRVNELSLVEWNYKTAEASERHFGPMAEDFHATFGLGHSPERLAPGDAAGVALAAIQGLHGRVDERLVEKDREIEALRSELDELKKEVRQIVR